MNTTELVPSVSIANLLNQREALMARFSTLLDSVNDLHEAAKGAHFAVPCFGISRGYRAHEKQLVGAASKERADCVEYFRQTVDESGWQYLMKESGIRSFMDASTREKWDSQLTESVPILNAENIKATFSTLHDKRGEMMRDGVVSCFKRLAWCYKTNLPQKFGKRIVVTHLISYHSHSTDGLDDLMRVFCKMDKKPEPDYRGGIQALLSNAGANSWSSRQMRGTVANEYISIKWFANQNGHITFLRPDLVDQLNLIIASRYPGCLPAAK